MGFRRRAGAPVPRQVFRRGVQQFGDRACWRPAAAGTVRTGDCPGRSPLFCSNAEPLVPGGAPPAHAADPFPATTLAAAAGESLYDLGMDGQTSTGPASVLSGTLSPRHPAA